MILVAAREGAGADAVAADVAKVVPGLRVFSNDQIVTRLERGGFLRREVSPNDRRGIRMWLEERGRRAVSSLRQETLDYAAGLMESLADAELGDIARALGKLVEAGRERRARDLQAERDE